MKSLTTFGRVIYAIPFGIFGIFHFMNASYMAENMVPAFMPLKTFFVYFTGVALIASCISLISGKMIQLATLLLGIMLLVFILTIHIPGTMAEDEMVKMQSMTALLKDMALMGAAFYFSGSFTPATPGNPEI